MKTGKKDNREWRFGSGEWDTEPDWAVFNASGFDCAMQRNGQGAWCGYVLVPEWHPMHGAKLQHGEPVWLNVHGGVTWDSVMHFQPELELTASFAVGFDCSHSSDLSPRDLARGMVFGEYCNFQYAMDETEGLASQIMMHAPMEQLCRVFSGSDDEVK